MAEARDARSRLYAMAERQAGYFTAGQACEAGYSYAAQAYHHKAGHWLRDGWGIYRLARFPSSPHEEFVRLRLWSRDRSGESRAVVSHESALELYELSDVLPAEVHLTVPKGFRKTPPDGVALYRADLAPGDVREWEGLAVTEPLRTLLDVAASTLSPEHLEAATLEALDRGLVRRAALAKAIREAPGGVTERFGFLESSA